MKENLLVRHYYESTMIYEGKMIYKLTNMKFRVLISVFVFLLAAECHHIVAQERYEVTSQSKLNVRSLPGTDSWVLGNLAPKEQVVVYRIDGSWAEIKYNNQTAYISAKYIKKIESVNAKEVVGQVYKVISQSRLNVRKRPSADSQILGVLQPAEQIEVLSIEGQWAKIRYRLNVGYVALRYIEKIKDLEEPKKDAVVVPIKKETFIPIITDESKKTFVGKEFLKNVAIELLPRLSIGYANFTSSSVSPVSTIGVGLDCALQFIAKEKLSFIPKDFFAEVSLGYSLRGSGAFPMHYLNLKLMPFGYRLVLADYVFLGKLGTYVGVSPSVVETNNNSFNTNADVGISIGLGLESNNIGVGISFEQGLVDVCDANLSLKNQCLFINLSYRLYDIKKRMFITK